MSSTKNYIKLEFKKNKKTRSWDIVSDSEELRFSFKKSDTKFLFSFSDSLTHDVFANATVDDDNRAKASLRAPGFPGRYWEDHGPYDEIFLRLEFSYPTNDRSL
jgi:hypothetical protein